MLKTTGNVVEDQARRLKTKTQDQQLVNSVVDGTGLSPWEAQVLVDVVKEVYFSDPDNKPLGPGQIRYQCVAASEGAGKPLQDCQMVTVVLTLLDRDDHELGAPGSGKVRLQRIMRLTQEAYDQGGLLSQEDLAQLLMSDARTIRRNIRQLHRERGIIVPTRGQVKDIGPGVTHREIAVRLWIEGHEPVAIAARIHHSVAAVERYRQHFSRVMFLRQKGFKPLQIALTVGISVRAVDTYIDLFERWRHRRELLERQEEIELIGESHWVARDQKKGVLSRALSMKNERRRP